MKKNDVFLLTVESVGTGGMGVCRHDGAVIFVSGALQGETHEVRIIKVYSTYAIGKSERRLSDSPHRIFNGCTAFPRCGGCIWQHIDYGEELKIKTSQVKENLRRIGKLEDVTVAPAIPSPSTAYWRNKILLPLGKNKEGKLIAGFYASHSHTVVSAANCTQQPPIIARITDTLLSFFEKAQLSVYDEMSGKGLLRGLCYRINAKGEILFCVIANAKKLKNESTEKALVSLLTAHFSEIINISVNENTEKTNAVLGKNTRTLFESAPFTQSLFGITYPVSVTSFFQVNTLQTETLYKTAFSLLPTKKSLSVLDLYCGTGSIGLSLLACMPERVKHLTGVEIVPEAVENAKTAAKSAGFENTSFFVGDAGTYFAATSEIPDLLIVDPPRKGCSRLLLDTVAEKKIPYVLYISCDSATLARDLAILKEASYRPSAVKTVDMFPRTAHIECAVLLTLCEEPVC